MLKILEMPNVAIEVVAESDNAASATHHPIGAKLLISLQGKLQEATSTTGLQVNRTGTLSEAASTPGLTVGT